MTLQWACCNTLLQSPILSIISPLWFHIISSTPTQVSKCGIVESVQSWMKFKTQEKLNKKCSGTKQNKLKGIPKLDDANEAGTRNSHLCTLILTEGDSAKTLAVAGLGVVGRDHYGVFPLRGKVLNVREATHKQVDWECVLIGLGWN